MNVDSRAQQLRLRSKRASHATAKLTQNPRTESDFTHDSQSTLLIPPPTLGLSPLLLLCVNFGLHFGEVKRKVLLCGILFRSLLSYQLIATVCFCRKSRLLPCACTHAVWRESTMMNFLKVSIYMYRFRFLLCS